MLLCCQQFEQQLEERYNKNFMDIPLQDDMMILFGKIDEYITIDPYVKLLSILELSELRNFLKYFYVCLKKANISCLDEKDLDLYDFDISILKDSVLLQVLCVVTMQYYFV